MGTTQSVFSAFRYLAVQVLATSIDLKQIDRNVEHWLNEIKCGWLNINLI